MPTNSYLVQIRALQRSHLNKLHKDLRKKSTTVKEKSRSGNRAMKKGSY